MIKHLVQKYEDNLEEQEDIYDDPENDGTGDNDYGLPDYKNLHYH